MPRKKKTPVVTPAIDLPKEFLEKLIPVRWTRPGSKPCSSS